MINNKAEIFPLARLNDSFTPISSTLSLIANNKAILLQKKRIAVKSIKIPATPNKINVNQTERFDFCAPIINKTISPIPNTPKNGNNAIPSKVQNRLL